MVEIILFSACRYFPSVETQLTRFFLYKVPLNRSYNNSDKKLIVTFNLLRAAHGPEARFFRP